MDNQDLFLRLKEYATGLEGNLRDAIESEEMWTKTASAMYIGGASIQEQMGVQDAYYSIRYFGQALVKLYEIFPEIKSVEDFYNEFPDLGLEEEE